MSRTSKSIAELALAQVSEWATPDELITLASILISQFEKNYSGLYEFDDHDCLGRISRQIEQLADAMDIAKEEANAINDNRDYQARIEAIRRGYDVRAA